MAGRMSFRGAWGLRLATHLCLLACLTALAGTRSLAGRWRFELDRNDAGVQERWFERPLAQRIDLPGSLQNEGFGDDITVDTPWTGDVRIDHWKRAPQYDKYRQPGNIKVPFFLQPKKHYVGPAWYQREMEIPAAWQGKRVVLTLERPHWQTGVWVDGRLIGTNDSLGTPHVYDLGTRLQPGRHTLTIRVDNRLLIDVGAMAHSVTNHCPGQLERDYRKNRNRRNGPRLDRRPSGLPGPGGEVGDNQRPNRESHGPARPRGCPLEFKGSARPPCWFI